MSTMQRLTLIGLYNYEQQFERDLFSSLSLPAGYDKPTFINSLLLEHGEKCVLYTNPEFFKSAIGIWSGKWQMELKRIYEALTAEYNPIYNYDRYEESADDRNKNYKSDVDMGERSSVETIGAGNRSEETNAGGRTSTETNASGGKTEHSEAGHIAQDNPNYKDEQKNDYDVTNSQSVSASVEHEVSADNSATYQPDWKETTNAGTTKQENDGTITHTYTGSTQDLREQSTNDLEGHENSNSKTDGEEVSNSRTIGQDSTNEKTDGENVSNSKTRDSELENNEHRAHLYGNVGVTTSASMVTEVVQQRVNMNLYDIATRLFANELLIGVY